VVSDLMSTEHLDAENALDESVLKDLQRRVLDPILHSGLSEEELEGSSVRAEMVPRTTSMGVVASAWARGEFWSCIVWQEGCEPVSYQEIGDRLADSLADWVAETRFGWGQQRKISFQLGA
jgi:hypothetical protein